MDRIEVLKEKIEYLHTNIVTVSMSNHHPAFKELVTLKSILFMDRYVKELRRREKEPPGG